MCDKKLNLKIPNLITILSLSQKINVFPRSSVTYLLSVNIQTLLYIIQLFMILILLTSTRKNIGIAIEGLNMYELESLYIYWARKQILYVDTLTQYENRKVFIFQS